MHNLYDSYAQLNKTKNTNLYKVVQMSLWYMVIHSSDIIRHAVQKLSWFTSDNIIFSTSKWSQEQVSPFWTGLTGGHLNNAWSQGSPHGLQYPTTNQNAEFDRLRPTGHSHTAQAREIKKF